MWKLSNLRYRSLCLILSAEISLELFRDGDEEIILAYQDPDLLVLSHDNQDAIVKSLNQDISPSSWD